MNTIYQENILHANLYSFQIDLLWIWHHYWPLNFKTVSNCFMSLKSKNCTQCHITVSLPFWMNFNQIEWVYSIEKFTKLKLECQRHFDQNFQQKLFKKNDFTKAQVNLAYKAPHSCCQKSIWAITNNILSLFFKESLSSVDS